jgi:hypothetical protein
MIGPQYGNQAKTIENVEVSCVYNAEKSSSDDKPIVLYYSITAVKSKHFGYNEARVGANSIAGLRKFTKISP